MAEDQAAEASGWSKGRSSASAGWKTSKAGQSAIAARWKASSSSQTRGIVATTTKAGKLMLLHDLYIIDDEQAEGGISLRLNAGHPIFGGHFPGQPVLPGACQVQLVGEMLTHLTGIPYRLVQADQIKFLTMIDPGQQSKLQLVVNYSEESPGRLRVVAVLSAGGSAALKFNGIFQAE